MLTCVKPERQLILVAHGLGLLVLQRALASYDNNLICYSTQILKVVLWELPSIDTDETWHEFSSQ